MPFEVDIVTLAEEALSQYVVRSPPNKIDLGAAELFAIAMLRIETSP